MNRNKNFVSFIIGLLIIPIITGILLSILKVFTPVALKFPSIFEIYKDFFRSFSDKDVLLMKMKHIEDRLKSDKFELLYYDDKIPES